MTILAHLNDCNSCKDARSIVQKKCLIMGPLDMKGLLGAATVMGTLMYGAGHVWAGRAHFYLHDHELSRSPPDESFIDMLKQNCCPCGGLTGLCHQLS